MPRRQIKVGEGGKTVGPMRPAGQIEIAGFRYDARTTGEFLEGGIHVIVEKVDAFSLIVRTVRQDDNPLFISDHHDEVGRAAHEEEQARRTRRLRETRRYAVTVTLGATLGLALFVWLKRALDVEVLPFIAWGAIVGAGYLWFLERFLEAAREIVSENVMREPHVLLYAVLPVPMAILGTLFGQYSGGEEGAILGAVAAAFVLPPILCLLWYLLVTLLEAL